MTAPSSTDALLAIEVAYDGDEDPRQALDTLVTACSVKHRASLRTLDELSRTHEVMSRELKADLADRRGAWEHVSGLAQKIPILRSLVPGRPIHVLLTEKVEAAQRRTQEIGNTVDRVAVEVQALEADTARLAAKCIAAAKNQERAARHLALLKPALDALEVAAAAAEETGAATRELEERREALRHRIWEHGSRMRLYATVESRLAGLVRVNDNFLEVLRNLHGNLHTLHEAGTEVLCELEANLAVLAGQTKASELSNDMQKGMTSLRTSVDKVVALASETSDFLTRNVDRMAGELRAADAGARIQESLAIAEKQRGGDRGGSRG